MKKRVMLLVVLFSFFFIDLNAQSWIVKDSILVFPEGFASWLKRNNGGVDLANPGNGNSMGGNGTIGTNQGVVVYDFNRDGKEDLTFQIFPSNNATREYIRGIFIQNTTGKYILDTNYVIKGKGDMWYGGFGDFNGDGLTDYHYITTNYHGADSSRKYNTEMVYDNWPEKVFINNGKSFDTLSLDINNLQIMSSYIADVDKDGADEIITTSREQNDFVTVYKYDKGAKKFIKIMTDLSSKWANQFNMRTTRYPIFNIENENSNQKFSVIMGDAAVGNNPSQPYNFTKFTYATYGYDDKIIKTNTLSRDSIFIPIKYSKEDADDYYKFSLHEVLSVYKMDIDKNGEEEFVAGGFYQNNYDLKKQRFAYGWRVLGLNGKDLTDQFFQDGGFDRNVDLIAHGLDIDENTDGIEMIPGTWGADGGNSIGTVGYFYRVVNKKFEKYFIRDIKHESGRKLDSTYFRTMQIVKYPNFTKNKNALLMYDFQDIKRASIVYQASCLDVVKPTFDKTVYAICGSDSTIVKLTNFAKTDSTIWYVNGSVKTTNIDQLSFKNADTFYVKKIDGNGCIKSSDQIIIKKFSLPSAPTISRDTANNLVSSAAVRNTWYKDGAAISDTTQKIKPTSAGSFTVKTSENGCASVASSAYYYLVTDIVNLSADEFIKLAPNPFQGQLNLDFNVKAYQKLNIEVFELSTGTRRAAQQNVLPGSVLSFGYLAPGTYIIKVSSNDQKLSHQFKMIKL